MLRFLVEPVIWVLLLLAVSLYLVRSTRHDTKLRLGWYLILTVMICLYILSTGAAANTLTYLVESNVPQTKAKHADVVVILGGGVAQATGFRNAAQPISWDRLTVGVDAFKRLDAHRLIVSGGQGQPVNEAQALQQWARKFGVSEKDIVLETSSRTTLQQAQQTKRLLAHEKQPVVAVVTSGLHMHRALWCFQRYFKHVVPYPSNSSYDPVLFNLLSFMPDSSALLKSAASLHEIAGLAWYRISAQ